jgi:hypothetical protein
VDAPASNTKVKQDFSAKERTQASRKAADKAKVSRPNSTAAKKAKAASRQIRNLETWSLLRHDPVFFRLTSSRPMA